MVSEHRFPCMIRPPWGHLPSEGKLCNRKVCLSTVFLIKLSLVWWLFRALFNIKSWDPTDSTEIMLRIYSSNYFFPCLCRVMIVKFSKEIDGCQYILSPLLFYLSLGNVDTSVWHIQWLAAPGTSQRSKQCKHFLVRNSAAMELMLSVVLNIVGDHVYSLLYRYFVLY